MYTLMVVTFLLSPKQFISIPTTAFIFYVDLPPHGRILKNVNSEPTTISDVTGHWVYEI